MRLSLLRATRAHFLYVGLVIAQIIIYDAWKLIVPEAVLKRWLAAAAFAAVITFVWYQVRNSHATKANLTYMAYALIAADILYASFSVYQQRGMASRSVILFVIPLLVAIILRSRRAIYATAMFAVIAYTTTAVSYFVINFNEGYKIELYGEVGFYSVLLFILANLLWNLQRKSAKDS